MIIQESRIQTKVLVLEDDFIIATDLAEIIEKGGFEVLGPAYTIEEADIILSQVFPDIAILDYSIQRKTSSDFAQKLLKLSIPVIFCSGLDNLDILPVELRAADLLKKPFNPEKVLELIHSILSR